jgi:hypothetical protein
MATSFWFVNKAATALRAGAPLNRAFERACLALRAGISPKGGELINKLKKVTAGIGSTGSVSNDSSSDDNTQGMVAITLAPLAGGLV